MQRFDLMEGHNIWRMTDLQKFPKTQQAQKKPVHINV